MAEALGHERRRVAGKLMTPAFDDAGRCSLTMVIDSSNSWRWQGSRAPGSNSAVAAADALRAELGAKEILK